MNREEKQKIVIGTEWHIRNNAAREVEIVDILQSLDPGVVIAHIEAWYFLQDEDVKRIFKRGIANLK